MMDYTNCAVCFETLEWVAHGSSCDEGHKVVCSICAARLRFICHDRRCSICMSESTCIFVTKAIGENTKWINMSVFPPEDKEGPSGSYWYHEDTQSYFDDFDQYKTIKEMCSVSCSVCDVDTNNSSKKMFRDINHLKDHLSDQHKLSMCNVCLEKKAVFIYEQKLYSKEQLDQHIKTGDSEVDETESGRGAFKGHPFCEFCKSPSYGDDELYMHMVTEHYKCDVCKIPNRSRYYKNYEELENHFYQEHFVCDDEDCTGIVFTSLSELERHIELEHEDSMV